METSRWESLKGKEVKDKVTGFTGICTGRTSWLYGCEQFCITPKSKENATGDDKWFDDGRIEIIGDGISPASVMVEVNGGGSNHPSNNRR